MGDTIYFFEVAGPWQEIHLLHLLVKLSLRGAVGDVAISSVFNPLYPLYQFQNRANTGVRPYMGNFL
jgi:hypothetical protein